MSAPDGLLIVDKPADWTSHDVVARTRRLAATRKVGHAGTLDPMATGVLVLGIGRATRLLGHLALATKGYDAVIRLGQATVTDDAQGDVVAQADASALTEQGVREAVARFVGDIEQVPSAVSAIKVDGERAYKRVRAGEQVELKPRPVRVDAITVRSVTPAAEQVDVDVHVDCSSGTYIRAIARDVGAALGVGGHLTALRRTRVGALTLAEAHRLDELDGVEPERLPITSLAAAARAHFPAHEVPADLVASVRNGRPLQLRLVDDVAAPGPVAVFGPEGEFIGLYEQHGPVAKAIAVFAPA